MKIPNINCKQYDGSGGCFIKPHKLFGFLRDICQEVNGKTCAIKERYPEPPPPPPPPPKRIITEDIQPLTEGKVRGGMHIPTKWTDTRPIAPPPSPKSTKDKILEKVEKKEFVLRCVAVDICPTCGYMLHTVEDDDNSKICNKCNLIFSGETT